MVTDDLLSSSYETKSPTYFTGLRADFIDELPSNPQAEILEIGCGDGATGEAALSQGKCSRYVGVELSERAANIAQSRLTSVVVGNVERLHFTWRANQFDALIMSEVLEHLVDPWTLLRKLHPFLKDGALVMASSPNVSQYRVIRNLVLGRWELTESGVMDRTHLRWFTPASYREMFEQAGYRVIKLTPLVPFSAKTRVLNQLLRQRFEHLFIRQIRLVAVKPAP